jgi:DNA-binding NarL/FixJ family response regulator
MSSSTGLRSIRVLIADDQTLVRGGFRMILEDEPGIEVVGEAADGDEAIIAVQRLHPDIVLLDIRMPRVDGLEALRRILDSGTSTKVVMLTTFDVDEYVFRAVDAGACGFLLKDVTPEQLIASVRLVAAGESLLAPAITRRLIEQFAKRRAQAPPAEMSELTDREREVVVQVARGLSNAEIAEELHLSPATVKTHVARILGKLGLRGRVQLVVLAYESGVVTPGPQAVSTP